MPDQMNTTIRRRPLWQRAVDHLAALAVAAIIYPAIVWAYRSERGAR